MKKYIRRIFLVLICVLSVSVVLSLIDWPTNSSKGDRSSSTIPSTTIPIYPVVDSTPSTTIPSFTETTVATEQIESTIPSIPDDIPIEEFKLNESELFVCNLIYSNLSNNYDTFISSISVSNDDASEDVYGISYVDYQEGYLDEEGKTYFSAGFISLPGETIINESEIEMGLEIVSLEEESDDQFSYVYSYETEDLHEHCVYNGKYIKYDIVDSNITYTEEDFSLNMNVDFNRGNIYNYDSDEYVFIIEEQDFIPVYGVSLVGESDYKDIIEEVNRILETQTANLTYQEVVSYVSKSQEALYSYLLGLQQETFMGVPTTELVKIARDLDPMEHLQIGVDEKGNTTIQIIEVIKLPTIWEKILVSLVSAIAISGGIFLKAVGIPIVSDVLIAASFETMTQVVFQDTPVDDIQWSRVAVAGVAGALSGYASSLISNGAGKVFVKEVMGVFYDGLIGGAGEFTNSLIAGYSFEEACNHFGHAAIASMVIGGIVKTSVNVINSGTFLNVNNNYNLNQIGNYQVRKLGNDFLENGISELNNKIIRKSIKDAVLDAYMDSYDDLIEETLKLIKTRNY